VILEFVLEDDKFANETYQESPAGRPVSLNVTEYSFPVWEAEDRAKEEMSSNEITKRMMAFCTFINFKHCNNVFWSSSILLKKVLTMTQWPT